MQNNKIKTEMKTSMNQETKKLEDMAEGAWQTILKKLYNPGTGLFYDYISSYEHDRRFAHLPTIEEISRQYPNTNGWGTGMEDSMIDAGVILSMLCDRYETSRDKGLKDIAGKIFEGMKLCATLSSAKGLLLRSVSPLDKKTHYIESSRDQYTHFVHGLWRYYHSELSSDDTRKNMREIMIAVSERMEKYVTAENNYSFCKENGQRGLVDRMWEVREPHEVARLPMIYAVTWDFTGEKHWKDMYLKYAPQAAEKAIEVPLEKHNYTYGLFQHQVSLETLLGIEKENTLLRNAFKKAMKKLAEGVDGMTRKCHNYKAVDLNSFNMDWRIREYKQAYLDSGYGYVFIWPREFWENEVSPLRESGEALLIQMMYPERMLPSEQNELLKKAIMQIDYEKAISFAIIYPLAAYWRAMRNKNSMNII